MQKLTANDPETKSPDTVVENVSRLRALEHDYILCYARSGEAFVESRHLLPLTDEARARYKNPDRDHRGDWQSIPAIAQAGHGTKSQF